MRLITLTVLSGFAVEGQVYSRGAKVEVEEELARDLLRRGKAELADAPAPVDKPNSSEQEPEDSKTDDNEKTTSAEQETSPEPTIEGEATTPAGELPLSAPKPSNKKNKAKS